MTALQTGINRRGYPQLEAATGRVLAGTAQRKVQIARNIVQSLSTETYWKSGTRRVITPTA